MTRAILALVITCATAALPRADGRGDVTKSHAVSSFGKRIQGK